MGDSSSIGNWSAANASYAEEPLCKAAEASDPHGAYPALPPRTASVSPGISDQSPGLPLWFGSDPMVQPGTLQATVLWNIPKVMAELDKIVRDVKTRVGGAFAAVGGGAEAAGGTVALVGGAGTPVMVLGGVAAAHGLDTATAGAWTAYTGETQETFTAQGLQEMGLSARAANLTDAILGLGLSLGIGFAAKSPAMAANAVAKPTAALKTAEQAKIGAVAALEQETGGVIGVAISREGPHMLVASGKAGDQELRWSEMTNYVVGEPIALRYRRSMLAEETYEIVFLPVSAGRAEEASAAITRAIESQSVNGTTTYLHGQSDCTDFVVGVLKKGELPAPMSDTSLELLQVVKTEAIPLSEQGVAYKKLSFDTKDTYDAFKLDDLGDDALMAARKITNRYLADRVPSIRTAVLGHANDLARQQETLTHAVRGATTSQREAEAALSLAQMQWAKEADIAIGASAVSAGVDATRTVEELLCAEDDGKP